MNNAVLLGILGGLGPMSSVYFCEMLTSHTNAQRDSDHINFLLSSRADTPDRSSFILGKSLCDPSPVMACEAKRLENAGASLLAIPCNTAHYFYQKICDAVNIPVINIIEETARFCAYLGVRKVGVASTEGTAASGAYTEVFARFGIVVEPLLKAEQDTVSRIIFEEVKCGKEPDTTALLAICEQLKERGCERMILGCTELSLIKKSCALDGFYVDSLELLALEAIRRCKKEPIGFGEELIKYFGDAEKGQKKEI